MKIRCGSLACNQINVFWIHDIAEESFSVFQRLAHSRNSRGLSLHNRVLPKPLNVRTSSLKFTRNSRLDSKLLTLSNNNSRNLRD